MKVLVALAIVVFTVTPAAAGQGGWDAARVGIGIALVGSGAGMLAVDPKQPTQPSLVRPETLNAEFEATAESLIPLLGGPPFRHTDPAWDRALIHNYAVGAVEGGILGAAAMQSLIWGRDRELYAGAFRPYVKRSDAMKYGGVAAVLGGAVLLAIRGRDDAPRADQAPVLVDIRPGHASVTARGGILMRAALVCLALVCLAGCDGVPTSPSRFTPDSERPGEVQGFPARTAITMRHPDRSYSDRFWQELVFNQHDDPGTLREQAAWRLRRHPNVYVQMVNERGRVVFRDSERDYIVRAVPSIGRSITGARYTGRG